MKTIHEGLLVYLELVILQFGVAVPWPETIRNP